MSTFTNNNVASGDLVRASDHNTQGANIASVVNGNIEADNLAANAVTTAKIADASVTNAKLNTAAGELGGVWTTWTPSYDGITVGNGTVVSRYTKVGKTITAYFKLTLGSTSAIGGGVFSLPVEMAAHYAASVDYVGTGVGYDNSASEGYPFAIRVSSSTQLRFVAQDTSGSSLQTTGTSSSAPFTWAVNDTLMGVVTYESV